ncbi:hypothetical protein PIB30_060661 [Stylosanthes scabra]|uniref:Transposase MuDR plant domain-containing protein n=1 Tax=Stylosanthes scabra TaxID=79078 RepID=A0ABU6WNG1_9FABA|nr:hypothetical protein [Stylosanthes scabra]
MGRDTASIWFQSTTPLVFQMQPINTLEELKSAILHNMGVGGGTMLVRRIAYRLPNIFPPNQFKFKIFWVEGDEHVREMFDLHRRYGTREVMELLTKMQTVDVDVGGTPSSSGGAASVIPCSPINFTAPEVSVQMELDSDEEFDEDFVGDAEDSSESSNGTEFVPESQARRNFLLPAPAPIPNLSSVSSHFHTLHLDDMGEEPKEGFGGGGDDYDVDGGQEFRVGHCFSTREATQMAVKNYNIRRASECIVVESDPHKYICRYKQYGAGCPWSIRVSLRTNLGYWSALPYLMAPAGNWSETHPCNNIGSEP